jgi:periplasmic protein TonB
MTENKKRKNRRVALVSALSIHLGLFILMFFLVAWVAPDPPLGGSGVFLNLGLADEGGGDYQPETAGDGGKSDEVAAKEEQQSPPPQESENQPIEDDKADAKEAPAEAQSESQVESPVTVTPPKKEEVVKPTEPKKTEQPREKPAEVKQQVNPSAVYDPNAKKSSTTTKSGEGKAGQAGNEGDDAGKTGDKGDERGVKEGTVYEGNPGKGGPGPGGDGGFGLTMSGWTWDQKPTPPKVEDNESGFVVFQITVNEKGEIESIQRIEGTLSPDAVQRCKDKINERSMVRTAGGAVPKRSTGTVRFELRVK